MVENKTKPTTVPIDDFLRTISEQRRTEAHELITIMAQISGTKPIMWGPSIIGFGSQHYAYDSGRQGDMPRLAFSPRKSAISIYFNEGFDRHGAHLAALGKYKSSMSCLYINKLRDIDLRVLRQMLEESFRLSSEPRSRNTTVHDYIAHIPPAARPLFDELRALVLHEIPNANEVVSYGIIGYKIDDKRARVFISGWKDHVAMYPIPKTPALQAELKPYVRGKGTLWFPLNAPLPKVLVRRIVQVLTKPT